MSRFTPLESDILDALAWDLRDGESIAFDPAALMQPSPLLDLHQHADHGPPPPADQPLINLGALKRVQDPAPRDMMDVLFGAPDPAAAASAADESPPTKADRTSLQIGLWVAVAVGALLVTLVLRLPIFFAVFITVAVGRMLNRPPVLSVLGRATRRLGQYEYRPPQR